MAGDYYLSLILTAVTADVVKSAGTNSLFAIVIQDLENGNRHGISNGRLQCSIW